MTEQKLSLRNECQAAIFPELVREVAKGHWASSAPHGHSEDWSKTDVVVDPRRLGRNFDPAKDNYNFLDKEVVESTAKRAIRAVKLATGEEISVRDYRREVLDIMFIMRTKRGHKLAAPHRGMMNRPGRPSKADLEGLAA